MSRSVVLDASALIALLHKEPGQERVRGFLPGACLSSVNWSEVAQKTLRRGADLPGTRDDVDSLEIEILPFTAQDAERTAQLWQQTRHLGLSLGDRACLALGLRLGLPVLTADRAWARLQLGVQVQPIR